MKDNNLILFVALPLVFTMACVHIYFTIKTHAEVQEITRLMAKIPAQIEKNEANIRHNTSYLREMEEGIGEVDTKVDVIYKHLLSADKQERD